MTQVITTAPTWVKWHNYPFTFVMGWDITKQLYGYDNLPYANPHTFVIDGVTMISSNLIGPEQGASGQVADGIFWYVSVAEQAYFDGNRHNVSFNIDIDGSRGNPLHWTWAGTMILGFGNYDPQSIDLPPNIHSFPWVGRFQLCRVLYMAPPIYCILNEDGTYVLLESNDKIEVE